MPGKIVWKVAKNLLFLLAGLALLYLAFRGNDFSELIADLQHAKYSYVLLSMALGICAFISRGMRWIILLEPMGYKPRSSASVYAVIVGYLANLAIPRIGEITRCTVMSKSENIPVDKLFGTVILERILDLFILMTLTLITAFLKVEQFGGFFMDLIKKNADAYPALLWLLGIGALGFLGLLLALYILRSKFAMHPWSVKIRTFFLGLKEGLVSIRKIKNLKGFLFHTALIWFSYYLMTWVVFYALDETSGLGMIDGLFIMVVGGFGMAAPVQGGIGAYHLMVSMGIGVLGISQSIGLSYATILHTSQTILVLFTGLISFFLLYLLKKKSTTDNQI